MTAKEVILARRLGGGSGGGGAGAGTDLSAVGVYIADFRAGELAVTTGAVDKYARLVVT